MTPTEAVITVQTLSSQALSSQGVSYPAALWTTAAALKKAHAVWQIFTQGSFYINPNNYFGVVIGKALNTWDNPFIKYPTVPFFIMARFLDLFEQEDEWSHSKVKWLEALACVQPIHVKFELTQQEKRSFFISRHTVFWFKVNSYCLLIRVQRIVIKTLDFAFQNFKLLMRVMDIVDLINMEWNTLVQRSTLESGVNVPRGLAVIVRPENKEIFMERLGGKKIGLISAGKIYGVEKHKAAETAKKIFDFLEFGLFFYEKKAGLFGDAVVSLIKQGIYDWSPQAVKNYLKNNRLDPSSTNWLKKLQSKKIEIPPLHVTSYIEGRSNIAFSPTKCPALTPSKFPTPKTLDFNVYRMNGVKHVNPPLPLNILTIND
jgi:hypothetical protein